MLKISQKNTFYFLRYGFVRYVERLFTIIQKQLNMLKLGYFLKNLQTLQANNLRILSIKNATFSGYCFYMNANI